MTKEKRKLLNSMKTLIGEAAGTITDWDEMEEELCKLPLQILNALNYRIERAIENAHDDGRMMEEGRT